MLTTTDLPTATTSSQLVPLAAIQTDGGSQGRVKINETVVRQYSLAMSQQLEEGALRFPAVVLFSDGQNYWIGDGFHRVLAARKIGLADILAEVHAGSQRDAVLYALSANSAHGLPRTNADKRKAVTLLLADPEWSQWSDREIARRCQVCNAFVSNLRKGASVYGKQMRVRKVRRGDKVYEMKATPSNGPSTNAPAEEKAECTHLPNGSSTTDALGIPLSEPMTAIFAALADFESAKTLYGQLACLLDRIARGPAGEVFRQHLTRKEENGAVGFASVDLQASLRKLLASEPYCACCPSCHVLYAGRHQSCCSICRGHGWTTKAAFEACPPRYRQEMLRQQVQGR